MNQEETEEVTMVILMMNGEIGLRHQTVEIIYLDKTHWPGQSLSSTASTQSGAAGQHKGGNNSKLSMSTCYTWHCYMMGVMVILIGPILTAIVNFYWRYADEHYSMSIASVPSCGGLKLTFWILQDDVQTLQDETGTTRVILILLNVATASNNHDCWRMSRCNLKCDRYTTAGISFMKTSSLLHGYFIVKLFTSS